VSMELFEVAVLVAEHAANAKGTLLRVVEGPTILGLEAVTVALDRSACELLLAVSKITLFPIVAFGSLEPKFAEFGLVFPICIGSRVHWTTHEVAGGRVSTLYISLGSLIEALVALRRENG
jgi:hypothetical protein